MYRNILIVCDGQEASPDALALGRLVAADDEDARFVVALGAPSADEIHRRAEEIQADLLVVGPSRCGALGRVSPGDLTATLLHESRSAVAVAPHGLHEREARGLHAIGVGYDGSREARRALSVAAQLAHARLARLEVIGVVVPPGYHGPRVGYGYDEFVSMLELEMRERLESAPGLVGPDVSATPRLLRGEPATALAVASDALDLLVVGSRGHGPVGRALLGGVSTRVIRLAGCPVLVVPRGVAAPPPGAGDAGAHHGATPDA